MGDELLIENKNGFSSILLSYQTKEELALLKLAKWPRPLSSQRFLQRFFTKDRLNQPYMTQACILLLLSEISKFNLFSKSGNNVSGPNKNLMSAIQQSKIIDIPFHTPNEEKKEKEEKNGE